jgi:hypothetical protein
MEDLHGRNVETSLPMKIALDPSGAQRRVHQHLNIGPGEEMTSFADRGLRDSFIDTPPQRLLAR